MRRVECGKLILFVLIRIRNQVFKERMKVLRILNIIRNFII